MITKIKGKHFKQGDFIFELDRLNLFLGNNGTGKTAISQALCLAVNGWIPGVAKTNPAIFAAVAETGQDFVLVEFEAGKVSFLRRYLRAPNGTVSGDLAVNGRKATAQVFNAEMGRVGLHAIGDLSSFIGVSDRKKIDAIFDRYPPAPEMVAIDNKLAEDRIKLNKAVADMRAAENNLAGYKHNRSGIELPTVPLAECRACATTLAQELNATQNAELEARAALAREQEVKPASGVHSEIGFPVDDRSVDVNKKVVDHPTGAGKMISEFSVKLHGYSELSAEEQEDVSNNGFGKEDAAYIRIKHNGHTILLENDAMEPEDATFYRDLNWIPDAIVQAYDIGTRTGTPLEDQDVVDLIPRWVALESFSSILDAITNSGWSGCGEKALMVTKREIIKIKKWGKL